MNFMLDLNVYSIGLKSDNLVFLPVIISHHINRRTTNETNAYNRKLEISNLSVPAKAVT